MDSALTYAIIPAGPGDSGELARVHVQAWRETYAGILPKGYLERMSEPLHARRWRTRLMRLDEITLVAEGRDGLVGYASGQWARTGGEAGEAEITTLYVLKSAQGEGVGRALLTGVARAMADRGATSLVIWVLCDNTRARGFYERLGGAAQERRLEAVAGAAIPALAYRWSDIAALTRR